MLKPRNSRAALFAGVCFATLGGAAPSDANTMMWGATAIRSPAYIFIPEAARRYDRHKTKKSRPPKIEEEVRRGTPGSRQSRERKPIETMAITVTPTVTPAVVTPSEPDRSNAAK